MRTTDIQIKLTRYTEKDSSGELIFKPQYSRNHSVRIGNQVKTLMAWVYIAYYNRLPIGSVRIFSDNPKSISPEYMVCSGDFASELIFEEATK
jgi:hypothetical protein